jgi:hypothetical protein
MKVFVDAIGQGRHGVLSALLRPLIDVGKVDASFPQQKYDLRCEQ